MPRPLLTLTFDCLTLNLVCESHLRWETFLPNLGTLDFWVLELFAVYATDGQTDRQTDGQTQCLLPPLLWLGALYKVQYICGLLRRMAVRYVVEMFFYCSFFIPNVMAIF